MQNADPILIEQHLDSIEIWHLNRPHVLNAVNRSGAELLLEAVGRVDSDPTVRAVVIAGAGERAFCVGADLKERARMSEREVGAFLRLVNEVIARVDRCRRPVIAAIHGLALGGGLELALACDLRVASPSARLGLTETSLGIIPGGGGTQRLPRIVGEARAKELILLARRVDGNEAYRIGLVHRLADDPVAAALAIAQQLAEAAPLALTAALEAIDAAADLPLSEGLAFERRAYERTLQSQDRLEALRAFNDKRKPRFRGK